MTRRPRSRWQDLSLRRRRAIVVTSIVQVLLAVTAWWDLARRRPDQIKGSKRLWALAILVNFAGPIAYFTWGRRRADRQAGEEGS